MAAMSMPPTKAKNIFIYVIENQIWILLLYFLWFAFLGTSITSPIHTYVFFVVDVIAGSYTHSHAIWQYLQEHLFLLNATI